MRPDREELTCALVVGVLCVLMTASAMPATVTAAGTARYAMSENSDHWQRVELPPGQGQPGVTSQITVAIETKGPHLSGRIRIPGGIASNFETANGKAIVDLINVGSDQIGFAAITAVEIQFTEAATEQPFTITTIRMQRRVPKKLLIRKHG